MSSFQQRREARLKGSAAAIKEWLHLDLDPNEPVDVFGVIERSRVWLLFEPLDHLYGMFQRSGEVAGIALHTGHPLSLQRFTAAHELGHHILGHEFSQDSRDQLYREDSPLQEIQAQAFAAEFLMPLALVNRAQDRLGIPRVPQSLAPIDAYQLSLEMGSSYTATINQLNQLHKITKPQLVELGKWQPIDLKVQLGNGARPASSRADVWDVREGRRDRQLHLRVDDELHVRLPEIPTSGYRWRTHIKSDSEPNLELIVDELESGGELAASERIGSDRVRHLWWKATAPGRAVLGVQLTRPWEGEEADAVDGLTLPLSIEAPRTGLHVDSGVSATQRRAMLQMAA